jgi:hypothetical protein
VAPGALEPVVPVPAAANVDYFLHIADILGSSNAEGHENDFDIVGYEFDLTAISSLAGGSGSGTGKTTFPSPTRPSRSPR